MELEDGVGNGNEDREDRDLMLGTSKTIELKKKPTTGISHRSYCIWMYLRAQC